MEEKAIELLETLANQLGVAVPYLWEVLVRQAYVEAISCVVLLLASIIVLLVCSFVFLRLREIVSSAKHPLDWLLMTVFWGALFSAIGVVYNVIKGMTTIPTAWFNPEYWALQKIMSMM